MLFPFSGARRSGLVDPDETSALWLSFLVHSPEVPGVHILTRPCRLTARLLGKSAFGLWMHVLHRRNLEGERAKVERVGGFDTTIPGRECQDLTWKKPADAAAVQ